MPDYEYYAVSERDEETPWMLLRVSGAEICRWIPHLDEWVQMPSHWDYLSGLSSEAITVDRRKVSEAEAADFYQVVIDLPDDTVEEFRAKH